MNCLDRILRQPALRLAVAAFVIAAGAPAMAADCAQWNVAGTHGLIQSNVPVVSQMTLQQDGAMFKGVLLMPTYYDEDQRSIQRLRGDIVGTVIGNQFEATVYWSDSKVGVYSGQIGPQGLVVGRTFDKNHPATNADWHGSPAFDCAAPAPNGAGNNAGNSGSGGSKPVVALGRTYAPASSPKASKVPGTDGRPLSARNQQLLAPKVNDDAAFFLRPTIAQPREGGSYPPATPLSLRVAPAQGAKDTAYRIEIQLKKDGFIWTEYATLDAPAAVAQSPQGYRGWGGKQDAAKWWMTAAPGSYRLRASATAPQAGQPSDWLQFSIAGQPGKKGGGDAAQAASQPQSAQSARAGSAAGLAATGRDRVPPALLDSQALSPKTLSGGSAAPSLGAARNKAGPVLLNPQPLPPGGLQQAPSGLQQAPSSLR